MYRIGIDVGGTFTDLVVVDDIGRTTLAKVPSTPADPTIGVLDALQLLADTLGLDRSVLLGETDRIVHGTTVATNALLERRGAKVGLLTTEGHRDVIEMREGLKDDRYNLRLPPPEQLAPPKSTPPAPRYAQRDDKDPIAGLIHTVETAGGKDKNRNNALYWAARRCAESGLVDMSDIGFYQSGTAPIFNVTEMAPFAGSFGEIVLNLRWSDLEPTPGHVVIGDRLPLVLAALDRDGNGPGQTRNPDFSWDAQILALGHVHGQMPVRRRDLHCQRKRRRILTALGNRHLDCVPVAAECVQATIHDDLRGIHFMIAAHPRIGPLPRRVARIRKRILPTEIVPIIDGQAKRDDVRICREFAEQLVGGRARRTALAREQFEDSARLRGGGQRHARDGDSQGRIDEPGTQHSGLHVLLSAPA